MRIRYTEKTGQALVGGRVKFAIFGDPRGSTLSADSAVTDESGEAAVLVRAGTVSCRFEVRVEAPGASLVRFYVEVSAAGFGALAVRGTYMGTAASPVELAAVRYELLSGFACSGLDPLAPPGALRERLSDLLDQVVLFKALPLDRDHSLLALVSDSAGQLRAWGCIEIPRALLQPSRELGLAIPVSDFQPRLSGSFEVASDLSLPKPGGAGSRPLADALRPLADLVDCPRDPAQLLLDCIVDALDPADPLDCQVHAASPIALAIQSERGALDAKGCRGSIRPAGGTSLDELLRAGMENTGKTTIANLQTLPGAALATLSTFQISSELDVLSVGGAEASSVVASHRLEVISFRRGTELAEFQVSKLGLPAPVAEPIQIKLNGWKATIMGHGFGMRWGTVARLALGKLHLAAAGLPESSSGLAAVVVGLVSLKDLSGCAAVDAVTCGAARLPPGCLSKACPAGVKALGGYLDSGFVASAVKATDFTWTGETDLRDDDGDLRVDRMGTHQTPGIWEARLMLGLETVGVQQATFQAKRR